MERALVVEDAEKWQDFHRNLLESILGEGNVDVVANYDDATSLLDQGYGVYVLDVQFPRHRFGKPQLLGVQLAQEIKQREGSYNKIVVVSSHLSVEARNLGITKIYVKFSLDADKNEVATFLRDLRSLFNI